MNSDIFGFIATFILLITLKVTAWNVSADIAWKLFRWFSSRVFCTVQWLNVSTFWRNILRPFEGWIYWFKWLQKSCGGKRVSDIERFVGVDIGLSRGNWWGLVNTPHFCNMHMNQFSHPEDGDTVFLRNVATFSYAVQKPNTCTHLSSLASDRHCHQRLWPIWRSRPDGCPPSPCLVRWYWQHLRVYAAMQNITSYTHAPSSLPCMGSQPATNGFGCRSVASLPVLSARSLRSKENVLYADSFRLSVCLSVCDSYWIMCRIFI